MNRPFWPFPTLCLPRSAITVGNVKDSDQIQVSKLKEGCESEFRRNTFFCQNLTFQRLIARRFETGKSAANRLKLAPGQCKAGWNQIPGSNLRTWSMDLVNLVNATLVPGIWSMYLVNLVIWPMWWIQSKLMNRRLWLATWYHHCTGGLRGKTAVKADY